MSSFYPNFPTLVDALCWWSEKIPDKTAVFFLGDGEGQTARLSYADLDQVARGVAAGLQERTDPGERAILCFSPGPDFLAAYVGCLYAGVIAVPVNAPRNARHLGRLEGIVADADASLVLSDEKTARVIRRKDVTPLLDLTWLTPENIQRETTAPWRRPALAPSQVAFLQYTSGSTAAPKGVMVSHENLAVNIRMMGRKFDNHPETRLVSWLPFYHDMGLIGAILMMIWEGCSTVLMPPVSFIQDPVRWLKAATAYRATFIAAPNFGYELCCRQIAEDEIRNLDLSTVETACNGAEPVRSETMDEFCRMFGPAGFRRSSFFPCYGLAEATLFASGRHLGTAPGILVDKAQLELGRAAPASREAGSSLVVSCGSPAQGVTIVIADPQTGRERATGEIGEIWLAGDHVAKGYWKNEEATAEIFRATLPTRTGTFLRTGDLGFMLDGELFVTGRLKDLIIIFGRNFYPADIEATAAANPAISPGNCAAFAMWRDGVEGLGIAAEISRDHLNDDLDATAGEISAAIWEEHEASVFLIAFLKPASMPKTSSGKLRRQYARDLLMRNELPEIFRWPGPTATGEARKAGGVAAGAAPDGAPLRAQLLPMTVQDRENMMLALVRRELGVALGRAPGALDPDRPLHDLGIDSLMAAQLKNHLAMVTGLRLRSTLLFDYPSPAAIAGHLLVLLGLRTGSPPAEGRQQGIVTDEPVAVVSMSCRFPGGAVTPELLWNLLAEGRDAISRFPGGRGWAAWDEAEFPAGGMLHDADQFDSEFFGISPREALAIDPQQRLLLELSWEAIERAGIDPVSLRGSATGVFVGIFGNDYGARLRDGDAAPPDLKGYLGTGSLPSVASGRVAYTLGLEGPAISIDTACSSSLVAVHLACQALRHGECSLALAGGVTIMATPAAFAELGPESAGSPDGRCKPFSAEADGAGWSEGAGMVLLEPLSQARRNGHPVLAVVRGSAVNQDGRSQGLTAPNGPRQESVIRRALASARLITSDIDAVEAHGTGTALGDPIEANALLATYGQGRSAARPLWLGSLKSNIGHTQAAAGIAGLIKMVLALRHGLLPRTLHASLPSPHIDWSSGTMRLLNTPVPWAPGSHPRRAAISAFGISGTNAHLIIEEAAHPEDSGAAPDSDGDQDRLLPWVLSANCPAALAAAAGRLSDYLAAATAPPADTAWHLVAGRATLEHRAVAVASPPQAGRVLAGLAAGRDHPAVITGTPAPDPGRTVFVFPGQGSQWPGMGRELLESFPVAREQLHACADALDPHTGWSLIDVLNQAQGTPGLDRAEVVQPTLFAVMIALAALWQSAGVVPDAVAGHSQGEIAAAYVAGALSLEQAARIIAVRSQALSSLPPGAMASVSLPAEQVAARLARWDGELHIAAVNSPASTVICGPPQAVQGLLARCAADSVRARPIPVGYASHSPHIETIRDQLLRALDTITPASTATAFYSTVTAAPADTAKLDAWYWYQNLRQPVRLHETVTALLGDGYHAFIEASPHPILVVGVQEAADARGAQAAPVLVTGTLKRDGSAHANLLTAVARAHVHGLPVRWQALLTPARTTPDTLPTYPFQRQPYWLTPGPAPAASLAAAGLTPAGHPLLATVVPLATGDGLVATTRLSLDDHPWLADHTILGTVIVPGTAYLDMAATVGAQIDCGYIDELTQQAPLPLSPGEPVQVQVSIGPAGPGGRRPVAFHSRPAASDAGAPWTQHAAGFVAPVPDAGPERAADGGLWPPPGAEPVPASDFYPALAARGYEYGPLFQGMQAAWRSGATLYARVRLPATAAAGFTVHPALLDAALHPLLLDTGSGTPVQLPFSWTGVRLRPAPGPDLHVTITPVDPGGLAITAADPDGTAVAVIASLTVRPVSPGQLTATARHHLYQVAWTPRPLPAAPASPDADCAVLPGPAGPLASPLAAALPTARSGLAALAADPPGIIIAPVGSVPAAAATTLIAQVLALAQDYLSMPQLAESRLVIVTTGAVAAAPGDTPDPAAAAAWGLIRTAQTENPGRITLADLDADPASAAALPAALTSTEPQIALRHGTLHIPRLVRTGQDPLSPPAGAWQLAIARPGSPEITLAARPEPAPPPTGHVMVALRAAGLNFRDVAITLDMVNDDRPLSGEAAGVITAVGTGVPGLAPGDRVMGLFPAGIGPVSVTDHRLVIPIPSGWSDAQAATAPIAFLTAYYGLGRLARLGPGETVLLHAATGGVGMAALQLARHWGATVFATASPAKWPVLRTAGLDEEHIASSRTLDFEDQFLRATGGRGVDVVLNALAREFTDASLRLLPRGGRFIEMGKTDIRDPRDIAATHPGVTYASFDVLDAGPASIHDMLTKLGSLFDDGTLRPLPVTAWDIRHSPAALRHLSRARHTGKVAVTLPAEPDPDGTVLITGGTGTLGSLIARHLAATHGARHLLLISRGGPAARGAATLTAELAALGAHATVTACDAADRDALAAVLATIPPDRALTAVIHAAGVADDAIFTAQTPAHIATAFAPKAEAAWNLHELTRGQPLAAFVMFSSAAAILGAPGQANYAAANAFLDALADARHSAGLPATSLAWGLWAQASGMTEHLTRTDRARLSRAGMVPLLNSQALTMFDTAMNAAVASLVTARLDGAALHQHAAAGTLSPLLHDLIRGPAAAPPDSTPAIAPVAFRDQLAGLAPEDQRTTLTQLVRTHAATVLGHPGPQAIPPDKPFNDFGFDSLTAVELRNQLATATGIRLPTTLVFDHPTPAALAGYLHATLCPQATVEQSILRQLDQLQTALSAMSSDDATRSLAARRLRAVLGMVEGDMDADSAAEHIDAATTEEIFTFIDEKLGRAHFAEKDPTNR
jgi:mycoketide-CoA synthase